MSSSLIVVSSRNDFNRFAASNPRVWILNALQSARKLPVDLAPPVYARETQTKIKVLANDARLNFVFVDFKRFHTLTFLMTQKPPQDFRSKALNGRIASRFSFSFLSTISKQHIEASD
jgi:hypothetical protein